MEERAFWVAWSQVDGIGPILLLRLKQHFGTLAAAWDANASTLEAVDGIGPQVAQSAVKGRSRLDPERVLQEHEQKNPCFWTPADPDYPRLLLEIPDPPPVLYFRGQVNPQENQGVLPAIAIVGTRDPSDYGRRWTRRLSAALAQAGFTIVSGLAEGVDTEAHASCLSVGGRTWAVLGTGVDMVYPWSNRRLAEKMGEKGLLISEYPDGTPPDRANFPRRNRIIAGLSRVTLVLEAPTKSGALITARLANDYNRDVYVLPGSLDNTRSQGCLRLLSNGAHVILGENHLLEAVGALPRLDLVRSVAMDESQSLKLEPELEQVLKAITSEPVTFDAIVQQVSLTTGGVLAALSQLEILGLVSQLPGMRYQLSSG